LAVLTYVLFPVAQGFDVPRAGVGEVATEDVLAPFEYDVYMTPAERDAAAAEAARTVRPIYDYAPTVVDSVRRRLDRFFTIADTAQMPSVIVDRAQSYGLRLSGEEAQYLLDDVRRTALRRSANRVVTQYLAQGVAGAGTVSTETSREILVRRGDTSLAASADSVLTFGRYLELSTRIHPDPNSSVGDLLFNKILNAFFQPTLVPNIALTEARRAEVRAGVDSVKDRVRANERIIAAHEVVTPARQDRLLALQEELLRRGGAAGSNIRTIVGQALTNFLIVGVFWLLITLYLPETYRAQRQGYVLVALFTFVVMGSAATFHFVHRGPELIPIPFAAIVITVLFNGRIAMVAAMVLALLLGSQVAYGGHDAVFIALLGGVTAALSVRGIRRRSQILTSTALITAAFTLAAITVGLRVGWPVGLVGASVARGAANAVMSAALVLLALPIFESFSRATTDLTLLELSDPSRPLLRRLATEVPGTYAHSIAVANLCEAACNAIGANGLLARVGCYYHDIGKLNRPIHFAENQGPAGNPHDRLPPEVSATIIRDHVKEGLALAEEHRLPDAVKMFIPEHHGTREIAYFLDRARKRGPVSEETTAETYRYPGPKPRSAETAVAMLADGVEAVIRVLEDPTDKRVRDAISHVVKQRIDEGQLDDAPLTLGQIERVKEAFRRSLSGMYHNRIEYPAESGGITAHWSAAAGA
jgi:putative nucleotidyltransferase with HDIG domain